MPERAGITFCDWCGHTVNRNPCAPCCRRYESARAASRHALSGEDVSSQPSTDLPDPLGPES